MIDNEFSRIINDNRDNVESDIVIEIFHPYVTIRRPNQIACLKLSTVTSGATKNVLFRVLTSIMTIVSSSFAIISTSLCPQTQFLSRMA